MKSSPFDLVTVFRGAPSEAMPLQIYLDDRGFFTHLAHNLIKMWDPLITGFGMFDLELQVPRAQAQSAAEAIREVRKPRADISGRDAAGERGAEAEFTALEAFGRRLRWAAAGIGLISGMYLVVSGAACLWLLYYALYAGRARRAGFRPSFHRLTVLCVPVVLFFGSLPLMVHLLW